LVVYPCIRGGYLVSPQPEFNLKLLAKQVNATGKRVSDPLTKELNEPFAKEVYGIYGGWGERGRHINA